MTINKHKKSSGQQSSVSTNLKTKESQRQTEVVNTNSHRRPRTPNSHVIRNPARVATGSFSGYRFQIFHTLKTWLEIGDDRVIVAEGNEDIDHIFLDSEARFEESIKLREFPLGQLDPAIIETVLNYTKAFKYHTERGNKFIGILRTNAMLAQRPSTEIGKWIAGEKVATRAFLKELRAHAAKTEVSHRKELAYLSKPGHLTAFLKSVEWAGQSGTPEEVRNKILELLRARAPSMPHAITFRALLVYLFDKLSLHDADQRVLRRIDIDLAVSDAALEDALATAKHDSDTAWTAALWTSQGPPSVAVVVLVRDVDALAYDVDAHSRGNAVRRRERDPDSVLRAAIRDIDFIAYASRRTYSGKRGERVCAHDVIKQVKYRITPTTTMVPIDAAPWVDEWVKKRWPQPRRTSWGTPDSIPLALARLIGMAVLNESGERELLRDMESKLRWVHDIGAGIYFNAANPLR
jgi:hypothetical protein